MKKLLTVLKRFQSRIITAAVQDNKGGTVIGTKTYGKGIVQSTGQTKEGDAIELTIMQYFSPKGHTIADIFSDKKCI